MADRTEKAQDVLESLSKLNFDRIKGYKNAKEDTQDADLLALFSFYEQQSTKFKSDLNAEIIKYGGDVPDDQSLLSDVHQAWMDLKAAVTGKDRDSVLSSCEFGEQTIVKGYEESLEYDSNDTRLPDALESVIRKQLEELRSAKSRIATLHAQAD